MKLTAFDDNDKIILLSMYEKDDFMNQGDYTISSIKNTLQVLDLLSLHNGTLSVSQMAGIMNVSPSTITRMLQTFQECGWAEKSKVTKRYYLSNHCYAFMQRVVSSNSFIQHYLPMAHLIAQKYQFLVDFDSIYHKNTVLLTRVAPFYSQKLTYHFGEGIPAYCSSAGKAILSLYSEPELEAYFADLDVIKYQKNTYASEAAIRKALTEIKAQGYAVSNEEYQEGMISLSFPITNQFAQYYALTFVTTPANRRTLFLPETITYIKKKINENPYF